MKRLIKKWPEGQYNQKGHSCPVLYTLAGWIFRRRKKIMGIFNNSAVQISFTHDDVKRIALYVLKI